MSSRGALIAFAIALGTALLGVQLAAGGADFVPQRPADPCQDRERKGRSDLEGVAETVVLAGLDEAACKLGVSRERLLLALPFKHDRAELARELGIDDRGLVRALEGGLRTGVDRLERTGRLPKASALLPSLADQLGISRSLVDLVPDTLIDDLLPTADLLRWSLDKIDVNTVLAGLEERKSFESTLRDALVHGAIDEVRERITAGLPGPLQRLLG